MSQKQNTSYTFITPGQNDVTCGKYEIGYFKIELEGNKVYKQLVKQNKVCFDAH